MQTIRVQYFAVLREQRGTSGEIVETMAKTPRELYRELSARHGFQLPENRLKVALNHAFSDWDTPLKSDDEVVFIPPVAGG